MNEEIEGGEQTLEQVTAPEPTQAELDARDQGWVPKDEFNGDEHKWVDAGEFLRRGELFGKIESQNKEIKAIRETLAQFKDHHSKVQERAYKQALADLKEKKKEALIDGNADLVVEVDEQIDDVKRAQERIENPPAPQQDEGALHPQFVAFKQKNTWYESSKPMRAWADVRGLELRDSGKSPNEVLAIVEREVREEFPQRFTNPNRAKANAVESGTRKGSSGGVAYQPNEIEERMGKRFVREGLYKDVNEYYAELAKS